MASYAIPFAGKEHSSDPRCLHQHSGSEGDERWALSTARRANQRDGAAETTRAQRLTASHRRG